MYAIRITSVRGIRTDNRFILSGTTIFLTSDKYELKDKLAFFRRNYPDHTYKPVRWFEEFDEDTDPVLGNGFGVEMGLRSVDNLFEKLEDDDDCMGE